jgi:hypothetical protein
MAAGDQQYYMNPTTGQWQPTPYVAPAPAAAMPDQLSPAQLIFQQAGGNPADSASLATWMSGMYGGKPAANYTGQVDPATALGYYISQGGSPNVDVGTATSYYQSMFPATKTPESNALTSIAKTDPTQAAITTGLENSYNQTLAKVQAQQNTPAAAALNPALQAAYLKSLQQGDAAQQQALAAYNDPKAAALRAQTQAAYGSALTGAQSDFNLGTKLDPALMREIQQYVRGAQIARGNSEGGAQTVQEAMTQGSAGLALRQQRLQALEATAQPASASQGQQQQFLGQQQAYAGATQQAASGFNQAQQQYLQQVEQQATGYLGSGQTKYGQATTYLNNAERPTDAAKLSVHQPWRREHVQPRDARFYATRCRRYDRLSWKYVPYGRCCWRCRHSFRWSYRLTLWWSWGSSRSGNRWRDRYRCRRRNPRLLLDCKGSFWR